MCSSFTMYSRERERDSDTIGYKSNANSHNVHSQKNWKNCLHDTHSQLLLSKWNEKKLGCKKCFFHLISRSHINSIFSLSLTLTHSSCHPSHTLKIHVRQKLHPIFLALVHAHLSGDGGWCIRIFITILPFFLLLLLLLHIKNAIFSHSASQADYTFFFYIQRCIQCWCWCWCHCVVIAMHINFILFSLLSITTTKAQNLCHPFLLQFLKAIVNFRDQ